jgi:hypothetical protein
MVAAQEEMLGAPHPDLARSLGFLRRVLADRGRWDEGLQAHDRALLLARTALAPDHAIRREVVEGYQAYYRARGLAAEAERLRQEEEGVAVPGQRR